MSTKSNDVQALVESLRGLSPSAIKMLTRVAKVLARKDHQQWFVAIHTLLMRGPQIIDAFRKKPPSQLEIEAELNLKPVTAEAQVINLDEDILRVEKIPDFEIKLHTTLKKLSAGTPVDEPSLPMVIMKAGVDLNITHLERFTATCPTELCLPLYHIVQFVFANHETVRIVNCFYFPLLDGTGKVKIVRAKVFPFAQNQALLTLHDSSHPFEKHSRIVVRGNMNMSTLGVSEDKSTIH